MPNWILGYQNSVRTSSSINAKFEVENGEFRGKIGIWSICNFLCRTFAALYHISVGNCQCLLKNCDFLPRLLFNRWCRHCWYTCSECSAVLAHVAFCFVLSLVCGCCLVCYLYCSCLHLFTYDLFHRRVCDFVFFILLLA